MLLSGMAGARETRDHPNAYEDTAGCLGIQVMATATAPGASLTALTSFAGGI